MRVVFVLRSAEIFPVFYRFVLSGLRTCQLWATPLGVALCSLPNFLEPTSPGVARLSTPEVPGYQWATPLGVALFSLPGFGARNPFTSGRKRPVVNLVTSGRLFHNRSFPTGCEPGHKRSFPTACEALCRCPKMSSVRTAGPKTQPKGARTF
jgi:hypothetical protein